MDKCYINKRPGVSSDVPGLCLVADAVVPVRKGRHLGKGLLWLAADLLVRDLDHSTRLLGGQVVEICVDLFILLEAVCELVLGAVKLQERVCSFFLYLLWWMHLLV